MTPVRISASSSMSNNSATERRYALLCAPSVAHDAHVRSLQCCLRFAWCSRCWAGARLPIGGSSVQRRQMADRCTRLDRGGGRHDAHRVVGDQHRRASADVDGRSAEGGNERLLATSDPADGASTSALRQALAHRPRTQCGCGRAVADGSDDGNECHRRPVRGGHHRGPRRRARRRAADEPPTRDPATTPAPRPPPTSPPPSTVTDQRTVESDGGTAAFTCTAANKMSLLYATAADG